ncbi:MAG: tRNA-intron endonuclease family protein [Candidatus Hodarchaeales archaeon]
MSQSNGKKEEKYDCFFEGKKFLIREEMAIDFFYNKSYFGYLEKDELELEREEVVLLLERGRIRVLDGDKKELKINDIVSSFIADDTDFWSHYLVYKDLRERGYLVRKNPGKLTAYKLYARGVQPGKSPAKKTILPMIEGRVLELEDLDMAVKMAISSKKKLLLGVVDRVGEVTYYEASQLELGRNL